MWRAECGGWRVIIVGGFDYRLGIMKEVVCGVDVGSWTFKVCVYDWKTFEVLVNEANFRETPSLISYTHSQRLIGEEAANKLKSNVQNTLRAPLRLIGLEREPQLIEEELKDCAARYEVDDRLTFILGEKRMRVEPEELLIALLGKVRKMLADHHMAAELVYLSVPSYLSQHERRIIKRCAEVAGAGKEARIVDDWLSICSEYSFSRVKELNASVASRVVLFVDVGHAKTSFFVVEFGATECRLLDCEHLRFVGARSMDQALLEFYDRHYKRLCGEDSSLFSTPKAIVKLSEHVEKQRRVLSANSEHQLHAESLVDDTDLTYNLTRSEFEAVVAPVLAEVGRGLKTLKARMPEKVRLHSVELLGGASRVPALRALVAETFGVEPSKTLNQSEAMAHGTAIFGAKDSGLFFYDYGVINVNLVDVLACWNYSAGGHFLGEVESEYKYRQVLFGCNCKVPGENALSFGNEGPVEMYLCYGQSTSRKSIAYIRFSTPNKVRFTLDANKVVGAQLDHGNFAVCKFYEQKEERWAELRTREHELVQHEERLRSILELKNQYEAKIYAFKNKMHEYRDVMNEPETEFLDAELARIEQWIESEHTRPLGSPQDIHLYTIKIQEIADTPIFGTLELRKRNITALLDKYHAVKRQTEIAITAVRNEAQARKLHFLMRWLVESYENMKQTHWEGYYLTVPSLDFAAQELLRIQDL